MPQHPATKQPPNLHPPSSQIPPADFSGVRELPRVSAAAAESVRDLDDFTRVPARMSAAFQVGQAKLQASLRLSPRSLPKLWAAPGTTSTREDGEDESTEVAPWSKFLKLPVDTHRELGRKLQPSRRGGDMSSVFAQIRALDGRIRRTDRFLIAGGILLVAAILGGFAAFKHRPSTVQTIRQITEIRPAGNASPARAAAPITGDNVEVTLSASPGFAQFQIDKGPVLDGPWTGYVPRDDREHDVLVSAPGYFARVVKMRFARDVGMEVALQRLPDFGPPTAPVFHLKTKPATSASALPELPVPAPLPSVRKPREIDPVDPYAN